MVGYKEISVDEFECLNGGGIQQIDKSIPPKWTSHDWAICIVSSDKYAAFASVTIASIKANADSKKRYDIVVLSTDMRPSNVSKLMSLTSENLSIRFFSIASIVKDFKFYTWAHFTANTYYRLLIPDVFRDYSRVLYLDSDVVVNVDLSKLYNIDLSGYYLAAAYDTHVVSYCTRNPPLSQRKYNHTKLGLENPKQYFQCGVALYNIPDIRKDFGEWYLIMQATKQKLQWLDQDLINKVFANHILRLENQWNVMVANNPNDVDEYYLPSDLRLDYYNARLNPFVVHFVGQSMPCCTRTPDMDEYFWKYARQSPFYEVLLSYFIRNTIMMDNAIRLAPRNSSISISLRERIKNRIGHFFLFMAFKKLLLRMAPRLHYRLSEIYHSLYGMH